MKRNLILITLLWATIFTLKAQTQKIQLGTLYPGCDKTYGTCKFYNNLVNFRGEPFLAMLTDHSDESEA